MSGPKSPLHVHQRILNKTSYPHRSLEIFLHDARLGPERIRTCFCEFCEERLSPRRESGFLLDANPFRFPPLCTNGYLHIPSKYLHLVLFLHFCCAVSRRPSTSAPLVLSLGGVRPWWLHASMLVSTQRTCCDSTLAMRLKVWSTYSKMVGGYKKPHANDVHT